MVLFYFYTFVSMIDSNVIFTIKSQAEFEDLTFQIFKHQFNSNSVYRSFCDLLYKNPSDISAIEYIPFLPIQFFKSHQVLCTEQEAEQIFSSSGTTSNLTSKHYISDLSIYESSFKIGYQHFYGNIEDYTVLALLPSYLEREGSSLIYMVDHLISASKNPKSGFYLNNLTELTETLIELDTIGQKVLLIGVSFALLDLVETHQFNLKNTIIIETGGMKGRRKELVRNELHKILIKGFGVEKIHSEYGMTELLSQAYSKGYGIFECPNWMRILTRDTEDALTVQQKGKTGGINVIDLANLNSCSFIATLDLGKVYKDNTFEIIGRFDNSDIRGCNLMLL